MRRSVDRATDGGGNDGRESVASGPCASDRVHGTQALARASTTMHSCAVKSRAPRVIQRLLQRAPVTFPARYLSHVDVDLSIRAARPKCHTAVDSPSRSPREETYVIAETLNTPLLAFFCTNVYEGADQSVADLAAVPGPRRNACVFPGTEAGAGEGGSVFFLHS